MNFEILRNGIDRLFGPTIRLVEEIRFDLKADYLVSRYLRGEVTDDQLEAEGSRFPKRDLKAEVKRISLDTQIRNDPSHFYPIEIPREGH